MTNSRFTVRVPGRSSRAPHSALRNSPGFTYLALLAAIIIIGIVMGSAGKYWQNVMLREKEEELLFRGSQYRSAIEHYYFAKPGMPAYPQKIEDLVQDERFQEDYKRRHLRHLYKDPMTGEDFEVIRDMNRGNRIVGVYSKSEAEPLRQTGFSEENREFEGKKMYKEWQFLFVPQTQQQLQQGQVPLMHPLQQAPQPQVTPQQLQLQQQQLQQQLQQQQSGRRF